MNTDPLQAADHAGEDTKPVERYGNDRRSRLPMQAAVVGGVLLVAGGVIFWMHHQGIAPAKLLKPMQMRYTIEQTQARFYDGEDRIMRSLARSGPPPQIPVEEIPENPFRLERAPVQEGPAPHVEAAPVRDEVLIQAEKMLTTLRVEMVLNNEQNPLAKINGQVYRVGDKIDGVLEVVGISGRSVTLRAKTLLRTVEMTGQR